MRTFKIIVTTDNPDGEAIVRTATEKIACELDWGGDRTTSIVAMETFRPDDLPAFICQYDMEPD